MSNKNFSFNKSDLFSPGLELYRKCCSSCQRSFSLDRRYVRAYIICGKSFQMLGKTNDATRIWEQGLSVIEDDDDVLLKIELHSLLGLSNSDLAKAFLSSNDTVSVSVETHSGESPVEAIATIENAIHPALNQIISFRNSFEIHNPRKR